MKNVKGLFLLFGVPLLIFIVYQLWPNTEVATGEGAFPTIQDYRKRIPELKIPLSLRSNTDYDFFEMDDPYRFESIFHPQDDVVGGSIWQSSSATFAIYARYENLINTYLLVFDTVGKRKSIHWLELEQEMPPGFREVSRYRANFLPDRILEVLDSNWLVRSEDPTPENKHIPTGLQTRYLKIQFASNGEADTLVFNSEFFDSKEYPGVYMKMPKY